MAKKVITNWATKPNSNIYREAVGWYDKICTAYDNRGDADDMIEEYWNIYNAIPDDNQVYQGNSQCYIPVVGDAIDARAKRALRQLFPNKYRHVEAIGSDDTNPNPVLCLLEHYIRKTNLKSICRSMLIAGDVTGQWNVYVDWHSTQRNVSNMVKRNPAFAELDVGDPSTQDDVLEDVEMTDEGPDIIDFATEDLVALPPTCNSIEESDLSCIRLRMSKDQVRRLVDDGIFHLASKSDLDLWIDQRAGSPGVKNPSKDRTNDAGIRTEGTNEFALIYWAQRVMKFDDGKTCLADIYFAGEDEIVGLLKAPQWGQKRSVISAPTNRVSGSFNGTSRVEKVKYLQWNVNDFWNMGLDSGMYSMLPIIMTDPLKNPNYASMVIGLAAVWMTDPNTTKFANFPQLWKDSVSMCQAIKSQIWESLDVNEMMMGRAPVGRKNNAMVGAQMQEQSTSVIDHAQRFEDEILSPLMERLFEYDAQFRKEDVTVLKLGSIGIKAAMEVITPQQWDERYSFSWTGTDFVMGLQRIQQQIATMNVLRGIPPDQMNGRRLDITPILEVMVENVFGPELGQKILVDDRPKYSVPAEFEDEMMLNGIDVMVHEADDDMAHNQVHGMAAKQTGDPTGAIRTHMQAHMQALQAKRMMAMPQPPQGNIGIPGGNAPGVAGQPPRIGAQPGQQRPVQMPPGGIPSDQPTG